MIRVHVDDLKLTGEAKQIDTAISVLEKGFDSLKLEEDNFTHLGLKHTVESDCTRCVSQEHYIAELKPIPEGDLKQLGHETPVSADVQKFFMSLLGGISWVTQTRPDVAVFVSALQRRLKQPRACDVMNLNRVLKCLKLRPLLIALVDCDGLRVGPNTLRVLEFVGKKQSKVCRSTYAAELHSCLDLAGTALVINAALSEILTRAVHLDIRPEGNQCRDRFLDSPPKKQMRKHGFQILNWNMPLVLCS